MYVTSLVGRLDSTVFDKAILVASNNSVYDNVDWSLQTIVFITLIGHPRQFYL